MHCDECGDVLTEKDELEHVIVDDESYGVAGSPAEFIFLCADCYYWKRIDETDLPMVTAGQKKEK